MRLAIIICCVAASLNPGELRAEQVSDRSVPAASAERSVDPAGRRDWGSNVLIDASALVSDAEASGMAEPVTVDERLPPTTERSNGKVVTTIVRTGSRNAERAETVRKRAKTASRGR